MDHSDHAGGMGGMSMGSGVPNLFYVQKMYWAVVGAAIAFGTLVNVLNNFLALQRYYPKPGYPCSGQLTASKIPLAESQTQVHLLDVLRHINGHRARA
jgi:hypothetical protein